MKLDFFYLKKGRQYFPLIDLKLKTPKSEIKIKALVDSGATYSVFRAEVADYLGLEIEKGKAIYLDGVGGKILGYVHNISGCIGDKLYKFKIIFTRELTASFNILGRDNFFLPFLITFCEKEKKIIIREAK
ncbi:MAG: retropepsin-like domain-containing protein [Candidatus Omnitrophica bacterium]|nr:retropepsin-like domain-containing protein [Candidatus Omnitrophota bacterium]